MAGEKPKESDAEQPSSETTDQPAEDNGPRVAPKAVSEIPGVNEANAPFRGLIGAGIGTGIAGSLEGTKKFLPLIPNLINQVKSQPIDMNKPVSRAALQNWLNSMLMSNSQNVKLPVSELEKLTGKQIRTMSELGEAYKEIQEVKDKVVSKPMVKMVEGRPGVFEQTGRMTSSTVPGRPAIDLSPYEVKATGPIRQAVGRQLQTAGEVVKSTLPSIGRIGLGAAGGANAVMTGYDAWEMAEKLRKEKNPSWVDWARLASKTAATAGGGLSMLPFGITQAAGFGLQAPEMIWSGAESLGNAMKNADKDQVNQALSNVDATGVPLGGLP